MISRHEQDAPPLAGASQGTQSSITSSPPDLTVISEKEKPQQISSTPEEETSEPDQAEDLDRRTQKNSTVADELPEGVGDVVSKCMQDAPAQGTQKFQHILNP